MARAKGSSQKMGGIYFTLTWGKYPLKCMHDSRLQLATIYSPPLREVRIPALIGLDDEMSHDGGIQNSRGTKSIVSNHRLLIQNCIPSIST